MLDGEERGASGGQSLTESTESTVGAGALLGGDGGAAWVVIRCPLRIGIEQGVSL